MIPLLTQREIETVDWYDKNGKKWADERKKIGEPSFWDEEYRQENVPVVINLKVKTIVVVYPSLPNIICLIILLGPQGRVTKVGKKEGQLLVELNFAFFWKLTILRAKAEREGSGHADRRLRARTVA